MKSILPLAAFAGLAVTANAAIMQVGENTSGSATAYDSGISSTDLINTGAASLGGSTVSSGSAFSTDGANDGLAGANPDLIWWNLPGGNKTLTYTLSGSATGYDIKGIDTVYGWTDGALWFSAQHYDVAVTTVSNGTFTNIVSVDYDPFTANIAASTKVSLTDSTPGAAFATGVTGIRFTLRQDASNTGVIGVIREFDVIGNASPVPEPSSTALLGLGGLALILRRRR